MTRQAWAIVGIGAAAVAAFVFVALRWVPDVPSDWASPVVRTTMEGSVPAGNECLARIERPSGYLDACWHAWRETDDGDHAKDYYHLRVFGTFGPGESGSPRWARLSADLVGNPAADVLGAWPFGVYDGPCQQRAVSVGPAQPETFETLCGHTEATEPEEWTKVATWTCRGCLLPDDDDRSLTLHVFVAVPEGEVPEWNVAVGVGG